MLERLRKSRTEQKRRTVRAAILLDSVAGLSDQAIARDHGVNRNTVILCIQKCLRFGVQAALGELPRSGKPRRVSDAAMAWVQNSACQKLKELGYAQELWTYGLLTAHLRREARSAGYPELEQVSRSKLHKILMQGELRPHKVRYYAERRDPEFASKRAAVLHVYKEVEILNEGLLRGESRAGDGHGVLRRETGYSGASPENARPASNTWAACQPDPGLRIPTAGDRFVAGGAGSAPGHGHRDRPRDA
jgi:transposase